MLINKWWSWATGFHEEAPLPASNPVSRSPFLVIIGLLFFVVRRLSLVEHLKHLFYEPLGSDESTRVPARFIDMYVLSWLGITALVFAISSEWPWHSRLLGWFFCFLAVQTVQQNVFSFVWRWSAARRNSIRTVHSHTRNLLLALVAIIQSTLFLALTWWFGFADEVLAGGKTPLASVTDALYFSAVTSATVGFGDFCPATRDARLVAVLQMFLGMVMFAIVLARAVSTASAVQEETKFEANSSDVDRAA